MMSENQNFDYISRINKSIDYIETNISSNLSLEKISNVANFSPFHFHRIFSSFMGETLANFIKRIRVEKSAIMLSTSTKNIIQIAIDCGFSSSQVFARCFKEHFGKTPSNYRQEVSKNCNMNSKNRNEFKLDFHYDTGNGRPSLVFKSLNKIKMKVEVKKLPKMTVAYIRHIGPYVGNSEVFKNLFERICKWAGGKGLLNADTKFLSIYPDDPSITEENKLRADICVSIAEDTKVEGEIGKQVIEEGLYAVASFDIKDPKDYSKAWNEVYKNWLPQSGYEPADVPPFELYGPMSKHSYDHVVEICIPLKG
jgi:AraC family transcriptional regulator